MTYNTYFSRKHGEKQVFFQEKLAFLCQMSIIGTLSKSIPFDNVRGAGQVLLPKGLRVERRLNNSLEEKHHEQVG
jgi:hypothetical protein